MPSKYFKRPLCSCGCGEQVEVWRQNTAKYRLGHAPSLKRAYSSYRGKRWTSNNMQES